MTTLSSAAAATGLPVDRRSSLSGAALVSIVAATAAVPAIAAETPGPIEIADGIWLKAAYAADEACEGTWQVKKLYEAPERPRYLLLRSQGEHYTEIVGVNDKGQRLGRCYLRTDDANIEYLEAMIVTPFDPSKSEAIHVKWDRRSHRKAIQYAQETLQTIEAYRAECQRRADACGLTAALEHERPLMDACRAARDAIFAMTPATFREAAILAAVLREEVTCRLNRALVELAGIPAYYEVA